MYFGSIWSMFIWRCRMEGLRPTPIRPGQRISAAQQWHDKSMQQTNIQPLAPMLRMSVTHLTATSSIPDQKIAIRCIARGPIGKCLETVFAGMHRYVQETLTSCNVMVISLNITTLTCCLDVFWINLIRVHLTLRDGRTPTDTNSSGATTFGGATATWQINSESDHPATCNFCWFCMQRCQT